jgi:NADPH:quinone reductase-like Zn-dependent oxidoreductase
MKTIITREFGPVTGLVIENLPQPTSAADEVLIKVRAISINPVDVKTRAGKGMAARMKDYKPLILGWDVSGTVESVGKNVSNFNVGDEVFGMVNFPGHGKAYAEFVAAPASHLALKPRNISHEQAAAATLAALTAYQALVHHYKIEKGQRVFVHAASGGVGHFAVQIAKYFGAYVIGSSSAANKNFVMGIGADEHFDYQNEKPEDIAPVDFVLDCLGAENVLASLKFIKPGGSIVSILGGATPEVVEKAKAKNIRCSAFLVQSNGEDMKQIATLIGQKAITPHVSKIFPFEKMTEAHNHVDSGRTVGKVVVTV